MVKDAGGLMEVTMSAFLTYEERLEIEGLLKEQKSFGEIGRYIGKDRTTIAKEIKKYSEEKKTGSKGYTYNACIHRKICKIRNLCRSECTRKTAAFCKYCVHCNEKCEEYYEERCQMLQKPPFVCNGCASLSSCTLRKKLYHATIAQQKSESIITESRRGVLAQESEIMRLNAIISPLIEQGQSVHQIYICNKDELMCSEKTIYNYIDQGLFDVRNLDLPRKVRFRQSRKEKTYKVDRSCRNGRTYEDYQEYLDKNGDVMIVQMDSVIGKIGGKVLLTVHFVESSLMLAFLRDANTARSVTEVFEGLREKLGDSLYEKLFQVILTDNGSEFSNPKPIEQNKEGFGKTRVFYCDAGRPYQKGAIEVNHELIRRVLSKGKSFDELTQEDITLMMNHINSYRRKKLNNHSPYESFSFLHGETVLKQLGCKLIKPSEIVLKPSLLKK